MQRTVTLPDGERVVYDGEVIPDAWVVRVKEANGHREVSFSNAVQWTESDEKPKWRLEDYQKNWPGLNLSLIEEKFEKERLERQERAREKSAQRAKTKCRWIIKAQGLNELLTLTYRENQRDRELCKRHFKEWVRRMKAALGGAFIYCASFERQERGAMHVHVACHKLPAHGVRNGQKIKAWKLGTEIWRSIIGADNGLCFVGGKTKNGGHRRNLSLAKLAAYVSKYILKDYHDAPMESNRYSRSNGLTVPDSVETTYRGMSFGEVMDAVFACGEGDVIVSHSIGKNVFGERRYWLVTEPDLHLHGGSYAH
jgi:hypothetical protein